jgi:hypothetical protein
MLLGIELPDWGIPWAGIGGFLLGVGSVLSGWAALKAAKGKEVKHEESNSVGDGQPGGSG